jgi:hypothetical protein
MYTRSKLYAPSLTQRARARARERESPYKIIAMSLQPQADWRIWGGERQREGERREREREEFNEKTSHEEEGKQGSILRVKGEQAQRLDAPDTRHSIATGPLELADDKIERVPSSSSIFNDFFRKYCSRTRGVAAKQTPQSKHGCINGPTHGVLTPAPRLAKDLVLLEKHRGMHELGVTGER